jgi:Domain of unknown function (DUF4382)/Domain of unknown function (DUF5666)
MATQYSHSGGTLTMKPTKLTLLAVLAASALWACGGGGGTTGGPSHSSLQLFASDNLNTSYDHVWVKIKTVVLTSATGSTTIFDESATGGRLVDLRSLRDATGARFVLLSSGSIPTGTYTSATVTVDKTASLVPKGTTTAVDKDFADAVGANALLTLTFPRPFDPSAKRALVLDFDLSTWNIGPTGITSFDGFVQHGDDSSLHDKTRQEHDDHSGVLSGLSGTAPTQSFTITRGGRTLDVVTDASTVIFNNDGTPNPILGNGEQVEVTGVLDTTLNVLTASKVKIEVEAESENEAQVHGLVSTFDATAGTLSVNAGGAHGFVPGGVSINVTTDANTEYFGDSGVSISKDVFFASLVANTSKVEAEGTANSRTEILARRLKVETENEGDGGGGGDHHHQAELKGTVSALDATANTFDLTVKEFEGVSLAVGTVIHVHAANGLPQGLANGNKVELKGTYNADTKTVEATNVKRDN